MERRVVKRRSRLSANRYTDGQSEELPITFSLGLERLLGVHRGAGLLHAAVVNRAAGLGSGVSVSVAATERRRTTSSTVVGVIRIRSESIARASGSLGRRRAVSQVWHAVAHYPFAVPGCSDVRARLDRRAECHRDRVAAVCRDRAALGGVHTLVPSRALGLARASFERRYNHRLHQTAPREHG